MHDAGSANDIRMREKGVLTPGPDCTRSAEELGKYEWTRSPFTKGVMGSAYNRDLSHANSERRKATTTTTGEGRSRYC